MRQPVCLKIQMYKTDKKVFQYKSAKNGLPKN